MPILNKSILFCGALIVLASMAAGCQQTPTSQTATSKGNKTNAPVKKNCDMPPPAVSSPTSTNAGGKEYKYPTSKIYTSSQAIPQLWAKAREWAPDVKIRGGYHGAGNSYTPTDIKGRAHYGAVRGAEWAWDATFYSPSKKQEVYLGYIDGQVGGSIPQAIQESTFKADEERPTSIYTNTDDMIDSCVVYELAKANGFDEKENYHIYMTGDTRTATKYPGRKTWIVEERSRTDTDDGKESLGKVVNTYLIDGQTGELLEKREGRVYQF